MHFKNLLLTTVSALAVLGALAPASAADLPVRMPVKAPVVVATPAFSWTGFYIGVHGGGAWLKNRQVSTGDGNNPVIQPSSPGNPCTISGPTSDCSFNVNGGAFGGLAGYNWQSQNIVYGIEADVSWTGLRQSDTFFYSAGTTTTVVFQSRVDWLATVRGRIGVALSPTLIYITGGVAFGGVNSGFLYPTFTPVLNQVVKTTRVGWVAGGGIEHAFARNWTIRVEALYHDLGTVSAGSIITTGYSSSFKHRVTTARAALALRW